MDFRLYGATIARDPQTVYRYASNPENLPRWVSSFVKSVQSREGKWFMRTGEGEFEIAFAPENDLGVMDHWIFLPSGQRVYSPMRVIAKGSGSLVTFTLFRLPEMSDADFERDAGMIQADLASLKRALESVE